MRIGLFLPFWGSLQGSQIGEVCFFKGSFQFSFPTYRSGDIPPEQEPRPWDRQLAANWLLKKPEFQNGLPDRSVEWTHPCGFFWPSCRMGGQFPNSPGSGAEAWTVEPLHEDGVLLDRSSAAGQNIGFPCTTKDTKNELGPPVERLEEGYPFSVVYFSGEPSPQKKVKGHYYYWGT